MAELLALAGIAVGVALVFSALVANTSLTGSVRQLTSGIVGDARFQLASRGPGGFDRRLLADVQRIKGVRTAAPVLEAHANLAGPHGRRSILLVGGDPRFARFGGPLLQNLAKAPPNRRPGLVLPAPLADSLGVAPGGTVRVEIGSRIVRAPVAGRLRGGDVGSLILSPVALAPLPLAQKIAAMPDRVSRIFVKPAPGKDREVEAALRRLAGNRLNVGPADMEVAIFERAAFPTSQSTALFSVLSALVGFLFALSAMLLTVPQRRRLISDLRLAGYEPWVIVELLLFDALVLGTLGSLLGLTLGDQASRHLFDTVPGYLTSAFAIGSQRIVSWQSIAIAAGAGIMAACVAVLVPVRDALSRNPSRPASLASGSSREVSLALAGAVFLAVTAAIVIWAPAAATLGVATLTVSMLLLLPLLLRLASAGFDSVGRRLRGPVPILAVLELRSGAARIRTIAVAATGAVAVFATVAIGGAHADLQRGLDAATRDADHGADVWVTFGGTANIFGTTPFSVPPPRLEALRRLPGVSSVRRYGGAFLDVGDYRAWVFAPPRSGSTPVPSSQIRHGGPSLAAARIRRGGWVVLYDGIAAELGVGLGDRVVLPTPVPAAFRVAALSTNLGWPAGGIVMNADDFARAMDTRAVGALGVEVASGARAGQVARAVERTLKPSPLRVETRNARVHGQYASSRAGLSRLTQISALVLISAVLAMAAAMGGMIWQRRPTLAALKVHGFPELELWRALLLESGLLLGTGCLIGAVFGLFGQVLLSRALETVTGFPVFYSTAGLAAAGALALVTAVAVAVLAVPGWLAVRVRPVPGISA